MTKKIGMKNKPPIVGVVFFILWKSGPSSLTFWNKFNLLINPIPSLVLIADIKYEKLKKARI